LFIDKKHGVTSYIGLLDLTRASRTIAGQTYTVLEAYTIIAVIYLVWITAFTKVADFIYERKKRSWNRNLGITSLDTIDFLFVRSHF